MLSKVLVLALAVSAAYAQGNVNVPASGSANFQSPGYPNQYGNNINVVWNIQGPSGSGLQFDSAAFDTESGSYDTLVLSEIVNGARVVIGTFAGSSGPNKARSVGNVVTATFKTDGSVTRSGFSINVRVPICRVGLNSCPGAETTCIASSQYCDGIQDCPNNADEGNCPTPGSCGKQVIQPDVRAFRKMIEQLSGGKIVGGTEANAHSWPWQVAFLSSSGSQICGGSLVNKDWVVTAAHCCVAYSPVPASYRIRIGAHDLAGSAPNDQTFQIDQLIVHPNYIPRPVPVNDICLIKLKESAALNSDVSPVCLPTSDHGPVGKKCWVTGWGSTGANRGDFDAMIREIKAAEAGIYPKPNQTPAARAGDGLRQVDVLVSDQAYCNTAYSGQISPDMICAAAPGKDSCQGDSGGPFVCEHDGEYKLVGIVSWGRGCAQAGYPGVYARTAHFSAWINEYIYS